MIGNLWDFRGQSELLHPPSTVEQRYTHGFQYVHGQDALNNTTYALP